MSVTHALPWQHSYQIFCKACCRAKRENARSEEANSRWPQSWSDDYWEPPELSFPADTMQGGDSFWGLGVGQQQRLLLHPILFSKPSMDLLWSAPGVAGIDSSRPIRSAGAQCFLTPRRPRAASLIFRETVAAISAPVL